MPRYIDAEELLRRIWYGNSDSIVLRSYADEMVKRSPTADVVPASEVAKEFTCFVGDPHKVEHCPYLEEVEKARREVAREIFEEIENAHEECIHIDPTTNIGYLLQSKFELKLAELKKKYTEGVD